MNGALNHAYYSGDDNVDSAIRLQCIQNLITHDGITNKAAYLSKATKQHLLFLALSLTFNAIDHTRKYTTRITSYHDVIHLQTSFKPPMKMD